ncbi:hypothetical protein ACQKWADRAFT_315598 [Trichoderma austrokoningii]
MPSGNSKSAQTLDCFEPPSPPSYPRASASTTAPIDIVNPLSCAPEGPKTPIPDVIATESFFWNMSTSPTEHMLQFSELDGRRTILTHKTYSAIRHRGPLRLSNEITYYRVLHHFHQWRNAVEDCPWVAGIAPSSREVVKYGLMHRYLNSLGPPPPGWVCPPPGWVCAPRTSVDPLVRPRRRRRPRWRHGNIRVEKPAYNWAWGNMPLSPEPEEVPSEDMVLTEMSGFTGDSGISKETIPNRSAQSDRSSLPPFENAKKRTRRGNRRGRALDKGKGKAVEGDGWPKEDAWPAVVEAGPAAPEINAWSEDLAAAPSDKAKKQTRRRKRGGRGRNNKGKKAKAAEGDGWPAEDAWPVAVEEGPAALEQDGGEWLAALEAYRPPAFVEDGFAVPEGDAWSAWPGGGWSDDGASTPVKKVKKQTRHRRRNKKGKKDPAAEADGWPTVLDSWLSPEASEAEAKPEDVASTPVKKAKKRTRRRNRGGRRNKKGNKDQADGWPTVLDSWLSPEASEAETKPVVKDSATEVDGWPQAPEGDGWPEDLASTPLEKIKKRIRRRNRGGRRNRKSKKDKAAEGDGLPTVADFSGFSSSPTERDGLPTVADFSGFSSPPTERDGWAEFWAFSSPPPEAEATPAVDESWRPKRFVLWSSSSDSASEGEEPAADVPRDSHHTASEGEAEPAVDESRDGHYTVPEWTPKRFVLWSSSSDSASEGEAEPAADESRDSPDSATEGESKPEDNESMQW